MNKKVLILAGSPRIGGNSDLLCDEFERGALSSNNQVEKINVATKNIRPCSACYFCANNNGKCLHDDDMKEILDNIIEADVLVLASPVYFYSISAQLKAVIDRTVARWTEIKNKEVYYIVTMADDDLTSANTTIACLKGFTDCIEGAIEKGTIIGGGAYNPRDVLNTDVMSKAYMMGKNI